MNTKPSWPKLTETFASPMDPMAGYKSNLTLWTTSVTFFPLCVKKIVPDLHLNPTPTTSPSWTLFQMSGE
ncbi:hypothetical protein WICPIJ_000682 [Wickerhamomyces pijperi]|uniref:Uncharacterized protein n=1 Tax=Wickerhamomyces pijperi TaxID=599730 RepID=A0A9P8QGB2_WICPI|nr:hypothetical protein WICPIJ_000682 [Wickerhamomyces pijperi]